MRPINLYQIELASVFAHGRSMIMKLGYAYLLGLPFALIRMPANVRVIGISFLILFTSFYGAATTLVTRKTDGRLGRLRQLPIRRSVILADYLLSGALIDTAQVAVVIALLLAVNAVSLGFGSLIVLAGSFVASVLVLNALGMALGAISHSSQEVHLIGAFGVAIIAFVSGLFAVPERIAGMIDATTAVSPLSALTTSIESALVGGPEAATWRVVAWGVVLIVSIGLFVSRSLRQPSLRPQFRPVRAPQTES